MPVRDGDFFEVIVVGGGIVGRTLGLALAGAGVSCLIIEAVPGAAGAPAARPIALAYGSRKILAGLDLWAGIDGHATPIRAIHISDRGHFGFARLRARDYGVEALGYVSDAQSIGNALSLAHATSCGPRILEPYTLRRADFSEDVVHLQCASNRDGEPDMRLKTRLLVASDGGQSSSRTLAGISAREVDWQQSAISTTLKTRLDHENVAYERFTASGPIALLPMGRQTCGLVWTLPHAEADRVMLLDDAKFLASIQQSFGSRLGAFLETGPRTRHRLFSVRSRQVIKSRFALAGNAANHLHPVAGQGLNLGLRDASALAEVVVNSIREGADPGSMQTLRRYADWRRSDHFMTAEFTAGVVRLFSNEFLPLAAARDLGLVGLDSFGVLKANLARHAMGLSGRGSRLARGLPL